MKRSEINTLIRDSLDFFEKCRFRLPLWATWKPEQWRGKKEEVGEIIENMLGWDLTDFGSGNFAKRGLILLTLRNGSLADSERRKPYAEKVMVVRENQETPRHFHWNKMEDIINRGGGNLIIELHGSTKEQDLSAQPLTVKVDGMKRTVEPGAKVVLTPGESICLEPFVYHRFYGESGKGKVLVGEVSAVNDDRADNRFYEPIGRFPEIEEDEKPLHLLVTDYPQYL